MSPETKPDRQEALLRAKELLEKDETKFIDVLRSYRNELSVRAAKNPELQTLLQQYDQKIADRVSGGLEEEQKEELRNWVEEVSNALERADLLEAEEEGRKADRFSDRQLAEMLKSDEELYSAEIGRIMPIVERRSWLKIINNIDAGDMVVNFSIPADKYDNLKHLNHIFGTTETDMLLRLQREALRDIYQKKLGQHLKVSVEDVKKSFTPALAQDYKNSIFRLTKQQEMVMKELDNISPAGFIAEVEEDANAMMSEEITRKAEEKMEEVKNDKNISESEREEKLKDLRELVVGLQENGYRLNAGIAKAEGGEPKKVVETLAEASAKCRFMEIDRLAQEMGLPQYRNESFSDKDESFEVVCAKSVSNFKKLSSDIQSDLAAKETPDIAGINSDRFEVFVNGAFNPELLAAIRKGELQAVPADQPLYDKLYLYFRMMNMMDFVKPHTSPEITNAEKIKTRQGEKLISEMAKDAADYRWKINDEETKKQTRQELADIILSSERCDSFTSDAEFMEQARQMKNCTIVSIDLLNVGVDQLLNYESLIKEIETEGKTPQEIEQQFKAKILVASDKLTDRINEFRNKIAEIVRAQLGLKEDDRGLLAGKVGGDELTLALDTSKVDNKLLFKLKNALTGTGARIVTARVERGDANDQAAVNEALKKADSAINKAKEIEKMFNKINRMLGGVDKDRMFSARSGYDVLRRLYEVEDGKLRANCAVAVENIDGKEDYVVQLADGGKIPFSEVENVVSRFIPEAKLERAAGAKEAA